MLHEEYLKYLKLEKQRWLELDEIIRNNINVFLFNWKYGDGQGGGILDSIEKIFIEEFGEGTLDNSMFRHNKQPSQKNKTPNRKLSASKRKRVMEKYAYRCVKCNSYKDLHIDHIVPLSRGGSNKEGNLQVLCAKCNLSKGNKLEEEL